MANEFEYLLNRGKLRKLAFGRNSSMGHSSFSKPHVIEFEHSFKGLTPYFELFYRDQFLGNISLMAPYGSQGHYLNDIYYPVVVKAANRVLHNN